MDNERATLTGQQPQGAELSGQQSLLLGIRAINVLLGFGMATGITFDIQYPEQYNWLGALFIVALPVLVVLELIIKRLFLPNTDLLILRWFNVGAVVGALIMIPLVITPKCGWNNDQCKPVQHQARHAQ